MDAGSGHPSFVCCRALSAVNRRHDPWDRDATRWAGEVLTMAAWTIYISFLGAMVVAFMPARNAVAVRVTALLVSLIGLVISIAAIAQNHSGQLVTIVRKPWIPTLGIEYHLAADGISLVMILLTGIAAVAGVLFSWNIEK